MSVDYYAILVYGAIVPVDVVSKPAKIVTCYCGAELNKSYKFCPSCGSRSIYTESSRTYIIDEDFWYSKGDIGCAELDDGNVLFGICISRKNMNGNHNVASLIDSKAIAKQCENKFKDLLLSHDINLPTDTEIGIYQYLYASY